MKLNLKNKKDIDDKVLRTIIQYGLGFASRVKNLEERCIDDWESDKLYDKSSFVIYDGYIWKAKVTNQSSTWDEKYWTKVGDELSLIDKQTLASMINLSDEEIASLQSLISTEIRLDKCFSSSDTYNRLLNVEDNCKAFTLQELAKKTGASYKIVTNTTDMTSTEFLYLLANANNAYDIYALIDGTAQKIGDTTIDLSQFYTKTEVDNDFLKKTDADSKFATITTVDGKVDKTSILSTISSTPSNDKLLSEKAINDTLVKKTDITTTIDSSSTDTQVPSAKTVYNSYVDACQKGLYSWKITNITNTWVRVLRLEHVIQCASGIFTFSVHTPGCCNVGTFLVSKNFDKVSVKQLNFGGYNGSNGYDFTLKIRALSSETAGELLVELYTSITNASDIRCTFIPLTSGTVTLLNEKGSIPGGYLSAEWTCIPDKYTSATDLNRICTTSVADVGVTNIAPSDTTTFINFKGNSSCNYYVKNGVCYVSLWGVKIASTGGSKQTGVFLPKSANGRAGTLMTGNSDATTHAFAFIIDNGELYFDVKDANIQLYGSFSYPV